MYLISLGHFQRVLNSMPRCTEAVPAGRSKPTHYVEFSFMVTERYPINFGPFAKWCSSCHRIFLAGIYIVIHITTKGHHSLYKIIFDIMNDGEIKQPFYRQTRERERGQEMSSRFTFDKCERKKNILQAADI